MTDEEEARLKMLDKELDTVYASFNRRKKSYEFIRDDDTTSYSTGRPE